MQIIIKLEGNIPSKKNSRVRTRSGNYIPSKAYMDWQEEALWQVKQQCKIRFLEPVSVSATIFFGKKTKSDVDNKLTSILDMLVEGLVLRDDRYEFVPEVSARAEYRKGNPGAIIVIKSVDPIM